MKRLISFVLIGVMILGIFVGCEVTPKQVEEHTFPDAEYAVNAADMTVVGDKIYYIREEKVYEISSDEDETPDTKTLKPKSAAEVLAGFALVSTYSTDSVYIEEYDSVRYEQTALQAEGQYILPTKDKNIRNIVILTKEYYSQHLRKSMKKLN